MKEDLINKFKLPKYIEGKSFADASKAIEKKFEGLNDKAAKDTKQALMQRLADMQEYIKAQQAPPEQYSQRIDSSQTQMAMGGFDPTSMLIQKGIQTAQGITTGAVDAFNKTNIDTSGSQQYQKEKIDFAGMGKNLLNGDPTAGIQFLGDVIGVGKANKDIAKANQNFDIGQANQINAFKKGGYTDPTDPVIPPVNVNNGANGFGVATKPTGAPYAGDINFDEATEKANLLGNPISSLKSYTSNSTTNSTKTNDVVNSKTSDNTKEPGNYYDKALRYAPLAANALQYLTLDKPEVETREKLTRKYDPQLVDESRITKEILANQGNTARAIQNVSNGSRGFVAANLQGSDLNAAKGLGQGYVASEQSNNAQIQYGQQFDQQIDQFNISQNNLEQDLTDRNKGAYDTNRSNLISQTGTDLGLIGKEAHTRQMAERIYGYDTNGNYIVELEDGKKVVIDKKTGKPLEDQSEANKTNESAMGGYQSSYTSHMNSLMSKIKK